MTKKPRRKRIDTVAGNVEVMVKSAAANLSPPDSVPLEARDLPFFANIIAEFARSEWTGHQLDLAAMLARTMSDLEDDQRKMRKEGCTLRTDKGRVVNPRKAVIQMHVATIITTRRSLSLHARAQGGDKVNIAKRRDVAKDIEDGNPLDDDLLARPN